VDGLASYVVCPEGPTTPEDARAKFVALAPPALGPGTAIAPGSPAIVSSVHTGQFCRAVDVGKRVQVLCDVADVSQASEFAFTGAAALPAGWQAAALPHLPAGASGHAPGAAADSLIGVHFALAPLHTLAPRLPASVMRRVHLPPPQAPPSATRGSC
jgi:hypothetical protein